MSRPTPRLVAADALREAVGFEDLIEPVSRAFQAASAGRAQNGMIVMLPGARAEDGDVYVKTGVLQGHPVHIVKVSPWFAANVATGAPQGGFIAVLDSTTGHTRALLNEDHYLSDIRTAAAGALAARALAPETVTTAAVLGAGVQAWWQSLALHRERPFQRLLLWARRRDRAEALAERLTPALVGVEIETVDSAEAAVRAADVVVTATLAREPIVQGDWLRPGQHLTAVGADDASKCELDASTLRRARVFVDAREAAAAHGCVARAIDEGRYALNELAGEIGEVLCGRRPGRRSAEDITIAKFVGLGAQDLAAAETAIVKLGL